ncbi:PE family protein [Mycobacterium camsae]|uniref:PE family protein n=1 Tax=Mycobacterium gordonae TaxID=1778 RepID=UPI00197D4FF9
MAVRSTSFAVSAATTRLAAAGVDQVSAALAVMFGNHGLDYQNVAAAAAGFHDRFVQGLAVDANVNGAAESINTWTVALFE